MSKHHLLERVPPPTARCLVLLTAQLHGRAQPGAEQTEEQAATNLAPFVARYEGERKPEAEQTVTTQGSGHFLSSSFLPFSRPQDRGQ